MNTTQTVALLSGAIHIPLALTVWSTLHRRNARWPLALWVLGCGDSRPAGPPVQRQPG